MNERLDRAVERLLLDDRFLRRFRRNPERALRKLGLTGEEIEAVKRGHAPTLLRLGLDPSYVWPKREESFVRTTILRRVRRLSPALAVALFALPATPAFANEGVGRRRRSAVARISRYFGRRGFGGEFHARMARAGGRRAGRVTRRAATGRNSGALRARARNAARDFGIQPPPGPIEP